MEEDDRGKLVKAQPDGEPGGALVEAARLFSCAVAVGSIVAGLLLAGSAVFPPLLFLTPPFMAAFVLAAVFGGAGGAFGLLVARALDWSRAARETAVGVGAALAAVPGAGWVWVIAQSWRPEGRDAAFVTAPAFFAWLGVSVAIGIAAHAWARRRARRPLPEPNAWVAAMLAAVAGGFAATTLHAATSAARAWGWYDPDDACAPLGGGAFRSQSFPVQGFCWQGDTALRLAPQWLESLQLLGLVATGVLLFAALLAALGPFRSRALVIAACAGVVLVALCGLAFVVSAALHEPVAPAAESRGDADLPDEDDAPADPGTGFPGQEPRADERVPGVAESRRQFAALAAAAVEAAGPEAFWRDSPAVPVIEEACDGGIRLRIDAELAMGVITDTTSDEHDREVTELNIAAVDRIALAWAELGLGGPETMHGEPNFSSGELGAVEGAKVDFEFGVARPRVDGRCLAEG
ncbi:hypothetical protein [Agromyces albus]|uniref:hypothetical protein n=1 Tax=Agromyces albus TaxID=205332 RepID=UPI0027851302|nr:hypothetical protein [Agromyces albus]MDQ0575802.1 hypothetical protein [Agromyces albus]